MAGDNEDYVYDEDSGEWLPASELAAKQAAADTVEVRDAHHADELQEALRAKGVLVHERVRPQAHG